MVVRPPIDLVSMMQVPEMIERPTFGSSGVDLRTLSDDDVLHAFGAMFKMYCEYSMQPIPANVVTAHLYFLSMETDVPYLYFSIPGQARWKNAKKYLMSAGLIRVE